MSNDEEHGHKRAPEGTPKPTVGRIVQIYDPKAKRVYAAIVTDTIAECDMLHDEMAINAHLFGGIDSRDELMQDIHWGDGTHTIAPTWRWPPRV